jgi:non-homologous end joining protein Ku
VEPDEHPDQYRERDVTDPRVSRPHSDQIEDRTEPVGPVSRIALRPHDPTTGEEIAKDEVVRGYEYERGQYVTFTPDELKALDLESSKIIDLVTLRAADELRAPQFSKADGAVNAEMLATARTIIERRIAKFDASKFRDRYQEALRELIEAKIRGLPIKPQAIPTPALVIDLMAALKRSLAGLRRCDER